MRCDRVDGSLYVVVMVMTMVEMKINYSCVADQVDGSLCVVVEMKINYSCVVIMVIRLR